MGRINNKKVTFDYENSIQKSNELSMAKLSQGLTLNQMQLLAYAIYCTQKDGKTEFNKYEFEDKFGIEKYQTKHAKEDAQRIKRLEFSIVDLERDFFDFWNVFQRITYDKGLFTFKWSEDMVPHILELKEKYVMTDLTITSKFRSSFSWTLYDYLKAHYGYWHKPISKESLMKLFGVEEKKTYQKNTGLFKKYVLDIAIEEINEHTELKVSYKEEKEGRRIIGFDLHWSTGTKVASATKQQINELREIVDVIMEDSVHYINLNNKDDREMAIMLIENIKGMVIHTKEPICINKNRADELLKQAKNIFRQLNTMLEKNNNGRDLSVYFNWLEGE